MSHGQNSIGGAVSRFEATLHRPAEAGGQAPWTFVRLPKNVSDSLPRRGRTSVRGTLNGEAFVARLEPDGQLGHWLKVGAALAEAAAVEAGDRVRIEVEPVAPEPEPALPEDLRAALEAAPEAFAVWTATTTIARVDWIHWIESARQAKTRAKRVQDACDMLASGKRRVCCFDPSGFYSKAFAPPRAAGGAEA